MIRLSAFHFFSSCSSSICCCCYWHCCCCRPFVNSHFLPCFRIPCVSREKYAIFDLILRTFRFSCCWCHCYTNVLWTLCLLLLTHYTHTHEYMFWYNKSSEKQRTSMLLLLLLSLSSLISNAKAIFRQLKSDQIYDQHQFNERPYLSLDQKVKTKINQPTNQRWRRWEKNGKANRTVHRTADNTKSTFTFIHSESTMERNRKEKWERMRAIQYTHGSTATIIMNKEYDGIEPILRSSPE